MYPANPALGHIFIHGTAQANGDVWDMMADGKEELLARSPVFRAVVAPVVTRFCYIAEPRATGAPKCDPLPRAAASGGGGQSKIQSFEDWSKSLR